MAARSLPLASVFVLSYLSVACGDVLPFPRPRPPRPTPTPVVPDNEVKLPRLAPGTKVDLQSAVVGARLRRQQGFVVADVECSFDLVCVQGERTAQRFTLAFPTSVGDTEGAADLSLTATINGKAAESVNKMSWSQEIVSGQPQTYHGYVFPATIAQGEKQTVTIKYTRKLPLENNAASFTYILRTGATWNAPISRETVRIVAEPGLTIKPSTSPKLQPAKLSDSELTWELRDVKPTEDIQVAIAVAGRR